MAILLFWSTDGGYVATELELEEGKEVETQVQDFCIEHNLDIDDEWISFVDIHGVVQMVNTTHVVRMSVEADEKRICLYKMKVESINYVV